MIISYNNGVTGLHDSHPRVIAGYSFALTSISFRDLPLVYETIGGSLYILLRNGCCWIKCQFCISICFKLGTDGRYCVTKGKIRVSCLRFCCRAAFLSSNVISARVVETRVSGYPLSMRFALNCEIAVLNAVSEELVRVRRSLNASLLLKPFLTPGAWQLEKCVYWNVSVALKWVNV